jgi:hypothetical protein
MLYNACHVSVTHPHDVVDCANKDKYGIISFALITPNKISWLSSQESRLAKALLLTLHQLPLMCTQALKHPLASCSTNCT